MIRPIAYLQIVELAHYCTVFPSPFRYLVTDVDSEIEPKTKSFSHGLHSSLLSLFQVQK